MKNKNKKIAIIGLGYVGLPLAVEFSKVFSTIGFDKNSERVKQLLNNIDETMEVSKEEMELSNLKVTDNYLDISNSNIYIITVPTPVDKYNNPDMSFLISASQLVAKVLKVNDFVIYESTVYPGATEEVCVPVLEKLSGLKYNKDFFCGYSPERINPGDKKHQLTNIKKITSGSNYEAAEYIDNLYNEIISAGTYKASSIAVAESAKVIENIQRDVNIALINELSMIFNKLDLDTSEILNAAASKWNFIPFQPGLVGGHCIGVDPYYLTHKAQEIGYHPEMILAGRRINDSMGNYISTNIIIEMLKIGINPSKAKVAILGLTFKENCPDLRNTKVPDIISSLEKYQCEVLVSDSYAKLDKAKEYYGIDLVDFDKINSCDVIIVAVSHNEYKNISVADWESYFKHRGLLIDVKSIYPEKYFIKSIISHWRL